MMPFDSADHSADLSADLSADIMRGKHLMDQSLNRAVPTSADLFGTSLTRTRTQRGLPERGALVGTAGTGGATSFAKTTTCESADPGTAGTADPAARWRDRRTRRAAWDAWEQAGGHLDDLPAGLASASLDACQPRQHQRDRWRR